MIGVHALAAHWWLILLRGIVAILFGVVAFLYPISTVAALVILFGAFALVDGLFVIVAALRLSHPQSGRWWLMLLQGLAGVLIGVATFFWPGLTALVLALMIAAWALVTGILEIGAAFRLRRDVPGEVLLVIAGILSVAVGIGIAIFPGAGLLTVVWLLGAYAIVAGVTLVILSFRLRGLRKSPS